MAGNTHRERIRRKREDAVMQRARTRRNEYNAKHPDKVLKQRENTYLNFLKRRGYTIKPPDDEADGSGNGRSPPTT